MNVETPDDRFSREKVKRAIREVDTLCRQAREEVPYRPPNPDSYDCGYNRGQRAMADSLREELIAFLEAEFRLDYDSDAIGR